MIYKKYEKIAVLILAGVFALAFPLCAFAESDDAYTEIYSQSGAEELKDALDDNAREFFESENIDPSDPGWVNSLTPQSVFSHIWGFIKSGAKAPLKAGFTLLGIVLVAAAVRAFRSDSEVDVSLKFAVTLAACGTLVYGVIGTVNAAVNVIKGTGSFMAAFVPVFMGLLTVSGAPVSAAAGGGMLLAAAEFTGGTVAFFITALMGAYLSVSVSASVSPLLNGAVLSDALKKFGMWMMALVSTVFLGVLSAGSAVNSAADSFSVKTAKFIIGTCVPVAGTALAGAVGTVSSSLSLLKSSVAVYGVAALAVTALPVIIELMLWRLVFCVSGALCSLFSLDETSKLFKAVDGMLAFLLGALLLVAATFIISLSVCVRAGRTV